MEQPTSTVSQPKPVLIIDTNAFIRCLDMQKLADKYDIFTSNNVLNEIRDKQAREKFNALTFEIQTASADDKSFTFVDDFSKKTGDYATLSFTDKELIAISVAMIAQRGKQNLLRKSPPELTEYIPDYAKDHPQEEEEEEEEEPKNEQEDDGFVTITKGKVLTVDDIKAKKNGKTSTAVASAQENTTAKEEQHHNENTNGVKETQGHEVNEQEGVESQEDQGEIEGIVLEKIEENDNQGQVGDRTEEAAKEDDSSDEDDGQGWINPQNISKKLYRGKKKEDSTQDVGVTIMTADYAMQNVIMQIGIPLLSTEGFIIRQTRRFVLECYACEKICKNPTKQFCPSCGNPTLTKLSVRVNDDGTMTFFRNPKKKISTRGKIYSIPKSEGGRNNNELLLREDEFLMKGRLQQLERQEKDKDRKFKQRLRDYENGMTFDDISLQHKFNGNKVQIGYGRINPNDRNQFKKKK